MISIPISLTAEQYSALDATEGARKRITAACRPGDNGRVDMTIDAEVERVLTSVNRRDLADAATKVRWSTLRNGTLIAKPKMVGSFQEPQEAPQEPQDAEPASMPPGVAAAGLSEALGGPLAHEGPAADQAKAETPRRQTKGQMVRGMLNREQGATNEEIQAATGWQPHTVRGFFAGNQMKGAGIRAERFEREPGVFAYRARAIRPAEQEA